MFNFKFDILKYNTFSSKGNIFSSKYNLCSSKYTTFSIKCNTITSCEIKCYSPKRITISNKREKSSSGDETGKFIEKKLHN